MRVTTILVGITLVWLAVSFWNRDALPRHIDYLPSLLEDPVQKKTRKQPFEVRYNNIPYKVEPQYSYDISGLVVSFRHHDGNSRMHSRGGDHLNMLDVCVVWGKNVQNPMLRKFKFWSGIFTCFVKSDSATQWQTFAMTQLSNNHLLSDREVIREQVQGIRIGDQIRMQGYLAKYSNPGGYSRGTSTTRDDDGDGACETIYVESFEILKAGNNPWRTSMYVALVAFVLAVLLHLKAPHRPYRD